MTRIDGIVLRRLGSRIGVAILLIFTIIALVESLDTWRFARLSEIGGTGLALLAIALNSALWTLTTLPVTLLIGSIIGILELQARRELVVINASGISIWQVVRAPVIAAVISGLVISFVADTAVVTVLKSLSLGVPQTSLPITPAGVLWLEQRGDGHEYTLLAQHQHPGGTVLEDVTFYLPKEFYGQRLRAPLVELKAGNWEIPAGVRFQDDQAPQRVSNIRIPTATTVGDLGVRMSSPAELTVFELLQLQSLDMSEPQLRAGVQMRLNKLLALPLMMAATVLLAFAFTTGYRRTNKYGAAVLYGIVLGFVVYVVTEMAAMAGSAGIIEPAFAAFAPALAAIFVGTTVLLYREDGRR